MIQLQSTMLSKAALSKTAILAVIALLGAGVVTGATSALADTPGVSQRHANEARADVFSDEIEVRLAEIEVVVSDRLGDPVAGLTRDDFELFQDGRPVELTHFLAIGGRVPVTGEAAAHVEPADSPDVVAADAARNAVHLVIYVDRGYLAPGDFADVGQALKVFLRQALGAGDRVMLVTAAPSLELEQSFTSVPELVVSKLDSIRARPGGGRLSREYQSILMDMRRVKNEGHGLVAGAQARRIRIFASRIQAYAAEVEGEILHTTDQLQRLIRSIAGLPGRRAVIYVGGRVPAAHGRRLFNVWQDAFGRDSNPRMADALGGEDTGGEGANSSDSALDSLLAASVSFDFDAQQAVAEVAAAASAHGIVFHTLDAAALRGSAFLAPGDATLPGRDTSADPGAVMSAGSLPDSMASLRALAWGTGGRSFTGGRDFTDALAHIGSDLKTYYSLGFEPLEPNGESSKIKVRLRRPGAGSGKLEVHHRSVLRLKNRDTLAAERTVSALLLEETENPLQIEVSAGEPTVAEKSASAQRGTGGTWRVAVSVSVPLAKLALVADGRVHAGRLSIYATSGGLDRMAPMTKAVVPVRIRNRDLLTSLGRRVAYQFELTLPATPNRIAVTVRDDFRPRSSTTVTMVGIEDRAGQALSETGSR